MTQGRNNGSPSRHGRRVVHIILERSSSNREGISDGLFAFCGVDNEINLMVFDAIGNIGSTLNHLVNSVHRQSRFGNDFG
jgi:hypothetical protein